MTATINPAQYIAAEVVYYALVDLIRQPSVIPVTEGEYDDAAAFFRNGSHVPWCDMAGIDADAVREYAEDLLRQYRAWLSDPDRCERPVIDVPKDDWRDPIRMGETLRDDLDYAW